MMRPNKGPRPESAVQIEESLSVAIDLPFAIMQPGRMPHR
jgi:hypothetical protein